jgi:predicted porin
MPSPRSAPAPSAARRLALAAALAGAAVGASAQTPSPSTGSAVVLYGSLDQYVNHMRSSSGTHVTALEDGSLLRSRIGMRGTEDLGGGYAAKFQLENGFSTDTGGQADGSRLFDRQAWAGLYSASLGEVRLGRQNGPIFARGGYIDFTTRTLGSVINSFGVPSRYDNTVSYISPRIAGVLGEVHFSFPETVGGVARQAVWQAGLDWQNEFARLGYAGLRGRPPANAPFGRDVVYDNVFANWLYGRGTVYLAFVRSNNSTSATTGTGASATTINNGASILGNVGGVVAGTNPDVNRMYHIWQLSADYRVTEQLRIGGLWGRIQDRSGSGRNANGGALGAYYDLSKRTTLIALAETIRNDDNAGFRLAGSGALKSNFTSGSDVNGRNINGVQLGILHRF